MIRNLRFNGRLILLGLVVLVLLGTGCQRILGQQPIHARVLLEDERQVHGLLDEGSDVNAPTFHLERTPLHLAARTGNYRIAKMLLDEGADVNAVDEQLNTPIHEALKLDDIRLATLFIERGADINIKLYDVLPQPIPLGRVGFYPYSPVNGIKPLKYCRSRGRWNMANLLEKHGARE